MTRLILTNDSSAAGGLKEAGRADVVISIERRFVWGPPPADAELAAFLAVRTTQQPGLHWLDYVSLKSRSIEANGGRDLGLIELCQRCETIELWIDPEPNDQLTLFWLLDYLRPHEKIVSNLTLVQSEVVIGNHSPEELAGWRLPSIKIVNDHLEAASAAWQAYRAPTPQDWFNLLSRNLSVLPQLRQAVVELLEELPGRATGLGATEMRMLELISEGNTCPFDVFPGYQKRNKRRVFGYWEVGSLLDGLARCTAPAVSGLGEGPFSLAMLDDRSRHARYKQGRLALPPLGEAILAGTDDFSRHNPVQRWWGATHLTNENLWRWDPGNRTLIAP